MAEGGAWAESHELLGTVAESFYAEAVNGSTVGDRRAPGQRTYALSEGLAGRTASGAVSRVRGPHEAHVRVVPRSASTVALSRTARPRSHARVT